MSKVKGIVSPTPISRISVTFVQKKKWECYFPKASEFLLTKNLLFEFIQICKKTFNLQKYLISCNTFPSKKTFNLQKSFISCNTFPSKKIFCWSTSQKIFRIQNHNKPTFFICAEKRELAFSWAIWKKWHFCKYYIYICVIFVFRVLCRFNFFAFLWYFLKYSGFFLLTHKQVF